MFELIRRCGSNGQKGHLHLGPVTNRKSQSLSLCPFCPSSKKNTSIWDRSPGPNATPTMCSGNLGVYSKFTYKKIAKNIYVIGILRARMQRHAYTLHGPGPGSGPEASAGEILPGACLGPCTVHISHIHWFLLRTIWFCLRTISFCLRKMQYTP